MPAIACNRDRGIVLGLFLLLAWASSAPADAPVVRNTAPAEPPVTLRLEEQWRIGGADSNLLIGTITEAATDTEGNVYLLDTQLCHVLVVAPDGELQRTIGSEGDGPGEVRRPRDVTFLPDGTLGLLELFPAKFVRLSTTGEPRGTLLVGGDAAPQTGFTSASSVASGGGVLVIAGQNLLQREGGQERDMYLARLSDTGKIAGRLREATMTLDYSKLHFVERELSPPFHLALAVGPDGRIFVPQAWGRYAVEVLAPDGTLERIIERTFENRLRTEDELRRLNALYEASARNTPYPVTREIEPSPPAIADLHVDPDGTLWVAHSRSSEDCPEGVMIAYDLFDREGRYLREARVACNGDPEYDGLEFLPDGRVLLIKGYVLAGMARTDLGSVPLGEEEDPAPMEIICGRLAP